MKRILFFLIPLISFNMPLSIYSQMHSMNFNNHKKQIRALEQIKLIEVLDLNEEVAVRFFARRNKFSDNVEKLQNEKNALIDELSAKLDKGENIDSKQYREKIKKIEKEIFESRAKFYDSLDDILTNEQIAKLIVFNKKFRREIMRTLMRKHRSEMKPRKK